MKKEKPAYLTITSLELPDSPIPLIDSHASARFRAAESTNVNFEKDEILDEFIESMTKVGKGRKKVTRSAGAKIERARKQFIDTKKCSRTLSFQNCSRNNAAGSPKKCVNSSDIIKECICSEITENLKINIQEKTEVNKSSRSPSPEVTHTIRIAMKYLGQPVRHEKHDDDDDDNNNNENENENKIIEKSTSTDKLSNVSVDQQLTQYNHEFKDMNCCTGVNVALDFKLNCNGVQLTSRDICLKPVTKDNSNTN
ncbi:uncharacterized protein LOC130663541 [Microplitis mediator]|uniref:uncharacterized protein LOC130663541 n=1 Tax=Microplitis mediator TaxID=375433 RepID=UPI002553DB60|nr:uncharacterized protein LOC130663541 [Microplitis mediator]XP_057318801.1 uncharacterized protein LOC130663541 [Microplitis mediator]XP_057318802.1 uncharacterized protein LOC130663541 [Microplitis mediator]XP_057318803.1 uncharacterized protein LOC130663541 [Microplitis mediator]XP_057318804.1 uncharacterized protein LOC130663541 [Microplitis mediator]XP_057318805.1 uncharacterized protein LOC130663541 [Microplitis mediator]XP_057318806.1 uncharacterized protein LOC130663541 [Microplitis 